MLKFCCQQQYLISSGEIDNLRLNLFRRCLCSECDLTIGGMKRLGLRSSSLSTETKTDAGTKASQTIEPQLFYDRVLGTVIYCKSDS